MSGFVPAAGGKGCMYDEDRCELPGTDRTAHLLNPRPVGSSHLVSHRQIFFKKPDNALLQ